MVIDELTGGGDMDSERPGLGNETCFRSMVRYIQCEYYYFYGSEKDREGEVDEDIAVLSRRFLLITYEDQEEEGDDDFDRRIRVEKKLFRKLMGILEDAGFEPEDLEDDLEAHLRNHISHAFYEMLENPDEPWQTWFIRLLPQ